MNDIILLKSLHLSEPWNDEMQRKAVTFWRERGFRFSERQGEVQIGRRGSLLGNMTSFDMRKLQATLTITNIHPTEVEFVMAVDTIYQSITEWNYAFWQLEMDTAESWLLFGDRKEAEWQKLGKQSKWADWLWCLTLGIRNRLPPSQR